MTKLERGVLWIDLTISNHKPANASETLFLKTIQVTYS